MTSVLEEVQKHLKVKSVALRNSLVKINNDIEPDELPGINSTGQSFRGVSRLRKTNYKNKEHEWLEYGFHYSVGLRLIKDDEENDDETLPLVEIKATFCAIYVSDISLNEEQIEAFSENNVGYHVWPYWREFMQSSCMRLDINPIDVPLYFCPPA